MNIFAVAIGGAMGAVLRFWVSHGIHALMGRNYPYGTLTVNVVGSLFMGVLYMLLTERLELGPAWRSLILVGLLGAFTTFSTFSLETLHLLDNGEVLKAFTNVVSNVVLCVAAVWLGVLIGRAV